MLKSVIAAIALVGAVVAPASAQQEIGSMLTMRYECKVTEATPPDSDKDPVSTTKIAIALTFISPNEARPSFFVNAVHTTASGVTYDVKDRYTDFQTGKVIEWGMPYWQAKDKKNRAITVFAGFETRDDAYVYKVVFSKDIGHGKFEKIKTIESKCDMAGL